MSRTCLDTDAPVFAAHLLSSGCRGSKRRISVNVCLGQRSIFGRSGKVVPNAFHFLLIQRRLTVSNVRAGQPGVAYPHYIGGERNGPPEYCGRIPGFCDPVVPSNPQLISRK